MMAETSKTDRVYTAIVRDEQIGDDIVLMVRAETPDEVRTQVRKVYKEQGWGVPGHVNTTTFRVNATDAVVFVGHAHWEYVKLQQQVLHLCERLMSAADSLESEGDTAGFDDIHTFLEGFEAGKKLLESRYVPSESEKTHS